jgi:hypothetical protein
MIIEPKLLQKIWIVGLPGRCAQQAQVSHYTLYAPKKWQLASYNFIMHNTMSKPELLVVEEASDVRAQS